MVIIRKHERKWSVNNYIIMTEIHCEILFNVMNHESKLTSVICPIQK